MIVQIKRFFCNIAFMFKRSYKLTRRIWLFLFADFIIGIIQPFLLLIMPQYILDELAGARRVDIIILYIVNYAIAIALSTLLKLLISHTVSIKSIKIVHDTEMEQIKKWLEMDYENFENGKTRDLAGECLEKVDPQKFIIMILGFLQKLIKLLGYTYIISSLHPIIVLILFTSCAVNIIITQKQKKVDYKYLPTLKKISRRYQYVFNNMIGFDQAKEVRINEASSWLYKKYDEETTKFLTEFQAKQREKIVLRSSALINDFIQNIIIYAYAIYMLVIGNITIGSFTVFIGAVSSFSTCFSSFVSQFPELFQLSKYIDKYKQFINLSKHQGFEKEHLDKNNLENLSFDIEFDNVSFKYPDTNRFVLKNISMKIKQGERLSLVGYNGAGKTTFIKLLCRLYEPTEGRILLGGHDISKINIHYYRSLLSVVFQDYKIFPSMTICDNIILTKSLNTNKLNDALIKSGIYDRISLTPKGIYSIMSRELDENGVEFSGGEKQKIAFARALYKDAPILILDEPTASLDPIAEIKLYERYSSIVKEKTSIYISHRLASVKFCDKIAVLMNGELKEYGTHEELLSINGLYSEMFKKQAHYYITD